jgi:predicted MFS family arabinose efflux permease
MPAEATAEPQTGWGRTFSPFRHRDFRLYTAGLSVGVAGDWIDTVGLNWLILDLGNSPFWLAAMSVTRGAPAIVFGLAGSVLADERGRVRFLVGAQVAGLVLAVVLGVLVASGEAAIWSVLLIGFLRGCVAAVAIPARMGAIGDMVEPDELRGAMGLVSSMTTASRAAGAGLAAAVLAAFSLPSVFFLNAATFVVTLACYALLSDTPADRAPRAREGLRAGIAEGLRFFAGERSILRLLALALVPSLLAGPYLLLLAVFARDWEIGAGGLGLLTALAATGSVFGGLFVAATARGLNHVLVMPVALVAFGTATTLFALSPSAWAGAPILLFVGAASTAYFATNMGLIMHLTPDRFRARVSSILLLQVSMQRLGVVLAAALAALSSMSVALAAMASAAALVGLLSFRLVRGIEVEATEEEAVPQPVTV